MKLMTAKQQSVGNVKQNFFHCMRERTFVAPLWIGVLDAFPVNECNPSLREWLDAMVDKPPYEALRYKES